MPYYSARKGVLALRAKCSTLKDANRVMPNGMVGGEYPKLLDYLRIREPVEDLKCHNQIHRKHQRSKEDNFSPVSLCS